jgi:hypothetical protein
MKPPTPVASDPSEILADWIEFDAVLSTEGQSSAENLVRLLRRSGSVDAISGPRGDQGSALSQTIVEDAFVEIENRSKACGNGYPFAIEQGLLRLVQQPTQSPYVLLLLMSVAVPTPGHRGTAVLFERICSEAALGYLGGVSNGAESIRFGAPRKVPLAKLSQALDDLCARMSEGAGCKFPDKAKHSGDEGLDIVAWRKFPDLKAGQLIAFGQCAGGGGNWQKKLAELDGRKFAQKWFREMFVVDPVRLFFLPRRIPPTDWMHSGIDGGILFDRCRIIACLPNLSLSLASDCAAATGRLLQTASKA